MKLFKSIIFNSDNIGRISRYIMILSLAQVALGKDLRKDKGDNQLVKHKDIELYLLLYIPNDYEE